MPFDWEQRIARRSFLAGGAALALAAGAGLTHPPAHADDLTELAQRAYIWGYGPMVMRHTLEQSLGLQAPFNQLFVVKSLPRAGDGMMAPNVDTLYGSTWLDLADGPMILDVPDMGDRYYSLQFIDFYTNTIGYVGSRVTGSRAGQFAMTGPGWQGDLPAGVGHISATTTKVFVIARTLVAGEQDLPAAAELQQQYRFCPLASYPNRFTEPVMTDKTFINLPVNLAVLGAEYFDALCTTLEEYPPFGLDVARMGEFAALGIGPGLTPSRDPARRRVFEAAIPIAEQRIRSFTGTSGPTGWSGTYGVTAVIVDPFVRAVLNSRAPGVQVSEEAMYFSRTLDRQGHPLKGHRPAVLRFDPGQLPPVDAFWSMSLLDGGQLTPNPINRYAIGTETPGLTYGPDGSLVIMIQAQQPDDSSNWLPAPEGPYQLILRTYVPQRSIVDGQYQLPPITVVF